MKSAEFSSNALRVASFLGAVTAQDLSTHGLYSHWESLPFPSLTATNAPTPSISGIPVPTANSYDYVIVGAGAAGIALADKLSESGMSVLLIEKGFSSSARWGGTLRPENGWLDGYNLTWFDIPGESNRIWNGGSPGVACVDTDQMAGCVLGGGTAINSGLWWKANPTDWDVLFPTGWKAQDMLAATNRVFSRIPGTDLPSMDGKRYIQSGVDIVTQGLLESNWNFVSANQSPGSKNRTFSYANYMFIGGERGGPMATYLVSANGRTNFHMWLNTSVERINRLDSHAVSLDVTPRDNGGRIGTVNLTPTTGRVIISSGTFGTAKLLFRSGIGPTDQLEIVANSTDAGKMIDRTSWINLPVGYNLGDHLNTDTVISHPNISYYNWSAAWLTPITEDKDLYLQSRSGPLAQAASNISPVMWEEITGPDGIVRQMQWTSRVEGSSGIPSGKYITLSLNLGRGQLSRGRTTIGKNLNMVVSTLPYGDVNDLAAISKAIDSMVASLKNVPGLVWNLPPPNQTSAEYLASIPLTYANIGGRTANHWLGSAKMGTDSGLVNNGTSVVDLDTKVYGTDNVFVVDASIFPGVPSSNPTAYIVTVAEKAAERILALPLPTVVERFEQCGGALWTGSATCAEGLTCQFMNDSYSWVYAWSFPFAGILAYSYDSVNDRMNDRGRECQRAGWCFSWRLTVTTIFMCICFLSELDTEKMTIANQSTCVDKLCENLAPNVSYILQ